MENEFRLAIKLFENKINEVEEDYKKKHKDDFEKDKMNKFVNIKLKKEINGLIFLNLVYPLKIIKTGRFK